MKTRFLVAAILAVITLVSAYSDPGYKLFAHRGGVVEDKFPDNSEAAIRAAVERGYWGLEIDIRETKDGVLVLRHDADLKLYYDDPRQLGELTWAELQSLPSKVPGHRTLLFEEAVKLASEAGLWLMLDSKAPHSPDFCAKLESVLRRHNMLERCYVIGTRDALEHFAGKALVGAKFRPLQSRFETDPAAHKRYFLFDHGHLTEEQVRWAQERGVKIVPSINTYHYYDSKTMDGKSRDELAPLILEAGRRDIEKLKALGVTEFQIDSEFDGFFESKSSPAHP